MQKRIACIFWLSIVWTGCTPGFQVGADQNPKVDFAPYQTFRKDFRNLFTKRTNVFLGSELTKKRVDQLIVKTLQDKGYIYTDKNPDLIFNFQTEVRNKQDVQKVNNVPAWGGYWSRWQDPRFNQTYIRDYEEMTLIIDMRDYTTSELLWQGWIIGELKYSENDWQKKLDVLIQKVLGNFPLKEGQEEE